MTRMTKHLLFSVGIKDCDVQTFRAGGKGGQHQNKTETGVRIIHRPSGATGESRETRSQLTNKRAAFKRMARSPAFSAWAHLEAARLAGLPSIANLVDDALQAKNLRIERRNANGDWEVWRD